MRVADIADLTDYQIEALYAAPAAEREAAASGYGPAPEKPDRPPTEDEYVKLARALWNWPEAEARAAYRRQVKGAAGG